MTANEHVGVVASGCADGDDVCERWHVRASMCELLSMGFRCPDANLIAAVADGSFADAAKELAQSLSLPLDICEGLTCKEDGSEILHEFRREYTRMFIGSPEPLVDVYESVWDARAKGVRPLLFIGPKAMEVERFCKSCGLGMPDGVNEPLDHVAIELELLEYLASLCAGIAILPEGFDEAMFPGGSPAAAYGRFMTEHLSMWCSDFSESVIARARIPFYAALGRMLNAFVEQETSAV